MCTTFVAKVILGIINSLLFVLGITMFIVGVLIHAQPSFSPKALSALLEKLRTTADKAGVTLDTSAFSAADVAFSFTVAIIVMGLFLAAVSLLGLIGVSCNLRLVLLVYFIITLVLFLAQVILVLIAAIDRDVFDDSVKPRLQSTIREEFVGIKGNDSISQIWNGIMIQFKCCGVDDYLDFDGAKKWNTNLNGHQLKTPVACCKNVTRDYSCAENPNDLNNDWKTGCYTKIWDFLISNSGIVSGIAAAILCAQVVILILTCLVMRSINKIDIV